MTVRMARFPTTTAVVTSPMVTVTVHNSRFRFFSVIRIRLRKFATDLGVSPSVSFNFFSGFMKSTRRKTERTLSPLTQTIAIHRRFTRWHSPSIKNPSYWTFLIGGQKKRKPSNLIIRIIVRTTWPDHFSLSKRLYLQPCSSHNRRSTQTWSRLYTSCYRSSTADHSSSQNEHSSLRRKWPYSSRLNITP